MTRALRLLLMQLRTSLMTAAQYRWDFLVDGAISLLWTGTAVIPLFVVYGASTQARIPGWTLGEAMLVTGWFILLQAILEGAISPGLNAVVDHIRKGTLDFLLLKPFDAQFLVSTSRFQVWRVTGFINAAVVLTIGLQRSSHTPSLVEGAMAFVLLLVGIVLLYSLWILIVSSAFYVVKVDNLTYLFSSIFDAARWPGSVFRGGLRVVFTFLLPLIVMTSFPAEALLGRLPLSQFFAAIAATAVFFWVSRQVWLHALGHYTSAGG